MSNFLTLIGCPDIPSCISSCNSIPTPAFIEALSHLARDVGWLLLPPGVEPKKHKCIGKFVVIEGSDGKKYILMCDSDGCLAFTSERIAEETGADKHAGEGGDDLTTIIEPDNNPVTG